MYKSELEYFVWIVTDFETNLGDWKRNQIKTSSKKIVGFNGISTFVGYLSPNPFLCIEFSLAWVHSLIVKNISI